jgi:hypothetical protein
MNDIEKNTLNNVYDNLLKLIKGEKLNTTNILIMAANSMKLVDTYTYLSGEQKKSIVIEAVKKLAEDNLEGEDEKVILIFIDSFLPSVIDTIVLVANKAFIIKVAKRFFKCFNKK